MEEHYFVNSGYPLVEEHKKNHRGFVEKLGSVEKSMRSGEVKVSKELLNFLKEWLIKHSKGVDPKYVPFVREK